MAYIYNLTDTWDAAGTTFSGIKMAVTNTASSASSKLLDLTISGATTGSFSIDRSGNASVSGALTLGTALTVGNGGTGTSTAFTAGSIVFAGASGVYSQNNTNLFWDNANGRLQIGYNVNFGVSGLSSSGIQLTSTVLTTSSFQQSLFNGGTGEGPRHSFLSSRGSSAVTYTSVASGDTLGELRFAGADGTSFIRGAAILSSVDGAPATNSMPGRLIFFTTPSGSTTPTERMRIDSAGRIGIGGAPNAGDSFGMYKNLTGATTSYGFYSGGTVQSDVSTAVNFRSYMPTQAASFTVGTLAHFYTLGTDAGNMGAGSAITTQYGYFAGSQFTGATNNFGFFSNIASGTGRWNFYANGTANNYFAGNVGIGATSFGSSAVSVVSIGTGTAPTTGPADTIQLYSTDLSAGNTMLSLYTEGTPVNVNATAAATHRIAIRVNGTVYYLLANTSA